MPFRVRDLTKLVARLLTIHVHPRVIRAGGRVHLALFRVLHGAGPIGADTLIITTRGRTTGRPRSIPLYDIEEQGRRYVAASFAGSATPPHWYLNLLADPAVDVDVKGSRAAHVARVLPVDEAKPIWRKLVAIYLPFAHYQERTERQIPVIELTPSPDIRAAASSYDHNTAHVSPSSHRDGDSGGRRADR